eukprot:3077288-Karenia_brevis.AAC.1
MDLPGAPQAHHVNATVTHSLSTFMHGNQQHDHMCLDFMIVVFQEHSCPLIGPLPQRTADDDIAISCTVGSPSSIRGRGPPYCRPGCSGGNNLNACKVTTRLCLDDETWNPYESACPSPFLRGCPTRPGRRF